MEPAELEHTVLARAEHPLQPHAGGEQLELVAGRLYAITVRLHNNPAPHCAPTLY